MLMPPEAVAWQDAPDWWVRNNLSPDDQQRLVDFEHEAAIMMGGEAADEGELFDMTVSYADKYLDQMHRAYIADYDRTVRYLQGDTARLPQPLGELYSPEEMLQAALDNEMRLLGVVPRTDGQIQDIHAAAYASTMAGLSGMLRERMAHLLAQSTTSARPDIISSQSMMVEEAEAAVGKLTAKLHEVVELHEGRPEEPKDWRSKIGLLATKAVRSAGTGQKEFDRQINEVFEMVRLPKPKDIVREYVRRAFEAAAVEAFGEAVGLEGTSEEGMDGLDGPSRPLMRPFDFAYIYLVQEFRNQIYGARELSSALDEVAQEQGLEAASGRARRKIAIDEIDGRRPKAAAPQVVVSLVYSPGQVQAMGTAGPPRRETGQAGETSGSLVNKPSGPRQHKPGDRDGDDHDIQQSVFNNELFPKSPRVVPGFGVPPRKPGGRG